MYGTELGLFPAPAPRTAEKQLENKEWEEGEVGAALGKSEPHCVLDPLARAGLVGRSGQCLGSASQRQSRRR